MDVAHLIIELAQNTGGLLGLAGVVLSVVALVVSLRTSYTDRISGNSWEIYRAYNSEPVRKGRDIALHITHETKGLGLPAYKDYLAYFGLDPAVNSSTDTLAHARQAERQHLHDLAAFYHQTGLLLAKGHVDSDFTLLLVGPGLEDRWSVLQPLASYYEEPGRYDAAFPYGGMYLLFEAYLQWKRSRFVGLRRRFVRARRQTTA